MLQANSKATMSQASPGKAGRKSAAIDIAALIGPQKLSQWFTQIQQADSFNDYLDGRFTYLDELNQGT